MKLIKQRKKMMILIYFMIKGFKITIVVITSILVVLNFDNLFFILNNNYLMDELNEKIKELIIKYGTIAVDTMITLILPFMPPFLSKE